MIAEPHDKHQKPGRVIIETRNLTRRFGGLVSVANVSFAIAEGETLGVIGPNGAGKTTLVNMISGTLAPSEGEVVFEGEVINEVPAFRRAHLGIARTFQVMKPFHGMSVLENVTVGALFGRNGERHMGKAREAAREWLEFTGLGTKIGVSADSLGGPDRKRLEFAKALAMGPRLLLLDEVMAGLNPVEVSEVVELIKKIRGKGGMALLVIEHVVSAIRSLSDRVMVLHHGEKIADDDPAAVLEDPRVIEAYLGKRRQ